MSGPNPPGPDSPTPDEPTTCDTPHRVRRRSIRGRTPRPNPSTSPVALRAARRRALRLRRLTSRPTTSVDPEPPRWPWVVGVVAIVAAIALVASVAVLVTRTDNDQPRHPVDQHHHLRAAGPGRDHDHHATPTSAASAASAHDRGAAATASGDGDGDPGAAATAAGAHRGAPAATTRRRRRRPPPTAPGRAPVHHVHGHRHEGAAGPDLGHLHRRIRQPAHPTERVHPVVADGDPDLDVGVRLGPGVEPVAAEQVELLDHHQRRSDDRLATQQRLADEPADDTRRRPRHDRGCIPTQLDQTDRILLAVCAALWLAALGAAVAAIVALVDLASRHRPTRRDSETPWLLYTVIGVSAVVIVGAIPLLIRARRIRR